MRKLSTLLPAYCHNRANKTVLAVSLWLLDAFKCDLDPGFYECRGLFVMLMWWMVRLLSFHSTKKFSNPDRD